MKDVIIDTQPPENLQPNSKAPIELGGVAVLDRDYFAGWQAISDEYDLLPPDQRAAWMTQSVEAAAVRTKSLAEVMATTMRGPDGNFYLSETDLPDFERGLSLLGILGPHPTEESISKGIDRAKTIIDSGRTHTVLAAEPFMNDQEFGRLVDSGQKRKFVIPKEQKLYVDVTKIVSGAGFGSWEGRGQNGDGQKTYDIGQNTRGSARSIDLIAQYASRNSQLPKLDNGTLAVVLTQDGPILGAKADSHRIAAAKLRGEPLAFDNITFVDLR